MADEPLSTKDLFLLAVGLYTVKAPPPSASSARDYYLHLDEEKKKYALRDTAWNTLWMLSPRMAWEGVRHRGWLLANIAASLTGNTHDFTAIAEPVFVSLDLLGKEFKPGMPNASEAIKQAVTSKAGYERSIFTTLTVGLSEQESAGQKVVVLGAGMRRRTRVWKEESQALQADVEFFVPFLPSAGGEEPKDKTLPNARSINAGIRISRASGSALWAKEPEKEGVPRNLAAVRFNLRVPFKARAVDRYDAEKKSFYFRDAPEEPFENPLPPLYKWEPGDLFTEFGRPAVEVQKLPFKGQGAEPAKWEEFKDWEKFVEEFCKTEDGGELLNAPVGPLLLETVSDSGGIQDILKSQRGPIKQDLEETRKALEETARLIMDFEKGKIPKADEEEPDEEDPSSSMRRLGGLLESLGLLSGKAGGGSVKYSLAELSGLTPWDVLNRLLDELDGFPLYVSGIDPKEPNAKRMAFSLASQAAIDAPRKHYFGIAGLAYNIPVKTTKEKKKEEAEEEEDPVLVLGQNYFTDEENIVEDDWVVVPAEEKKEEGKQDEKKEEQQSGVDLRIQLGKWFSGETLDDNWLRRLLPPAGTKDSPWKRRVPLPGIRLFPFQRTLSEKNSEAVYSLALRGDLLSLGVDIKGRTEEGLKFLQPDGGPLTYFGLGAIEARIALMFAAGRVVFGIGVKLKDMRLSFGEREETKAEKEAKEAEKKAKQKAAGDEIIAGLKTILGEDDWAVPVAPEPAKEKKPKTRLSGKKKDKFSISVGYLSPLTDGSPGTLDVQLYDEKGVRGKTVWIPVERRSGALYVKDVGIGLKGFENLELGTSPLDKGAQVTLAITGGLRWSSFELGLIGASVGLPLKEQGWFDFNLEGLDISFKAGPVVVSGGFLKSGLEFGGFLTVELPKLSISAIGFYGAVVLFEMKSEDEVIRALNRRQVHKKLGDKLAEKKLTPIADRPVQPIFLNNWQVQTTDGQSYTLLKDNDKLHLLSQEKAFFFYGSLSAGSGGGIQLGPIELTAVAVGFGINRRLKVPPVEEVADFPLVKMVMGEGGYQKKDESGTFLGQVSKAVSPGEVLKDMGDALEAESGQFFGCLGLRFTIAKVLDCFALAVVLWNAEKEIELSLLGLARLKQPSDPSARPICYVELQLLMNVKPKDGIFQLQGLLTSNSWIFNQDCKLTGGFAVFVWWGGPHKGDVVVTLGGYHPRFKRPEHYPVVPRLGLNWQVTPQLSVKGGIYIAYTPSCVMVGSRLEAVFRSDRVTVTFTAYLDVIVNWSPLSFEADIGVTLRVEASLFLFTLKATVGATLKMWGPPVGGFANIELAVITIPIPFGAKREEAAAPPIEKWERFCQGFLPPSEADKGTFNPSWFKAITQPSLITGSSNFAGLPLAASETAAAKPKENTWRVRPDQLELGAAAAVPVTTLKVGRVKTNSPPAGVQKLSPSGNSLLVQKQVELEPEGLQVKSYDRPLGVHPMGKALQSVLNVTVVRDKGSEASPVDLSGWLVETETASLPAALWDASKPKPHGPSEPSADLVPDCITGIKSLKPPAGQRGARATLTQITWHPLEPSTVPRTSAAQEVPKGTRPRNVQATVAAQKTKHESVAAGLAAVGFNLAWRSPQAPVRFRELQAEPLAGHVAPAAA